VTTLTVIPSAEISVAGVIDAPVAPEGGRFSLDAGRVPYAQAEVTLPMTDLSVVEALDPRRELRGLLWLALNSGDPQRSGDLSVQSRRVSHDGRTITIGLASDEAILQQYTPLTVDDTPLTFQSSLRSICNYVLSTVITIRRNLLNNPAVRTAITGWGTRQGGGSTSIARTTNANTPADVVGNGVARMTLTADAPWWRIYQTTNVPIIAGRVYTLSAWVRGTAATNGQFVIGWRNAANSTVAESVVSGLSIASGTSQWRRYSVTGVAPAGATQAMLQFGRTTGDVGDIFDMTGALFEQTSVLADYFDGDSPNLDGVGTLWVGAANASPSRMVPRLRASPAVDADATAYWTVTNLLTEPSHEGALGWVAGSNATSLGPATPAHSGSVAARWTAPAAGATWIDTAGPIRVDQGRGYTISTYMRSNVSIAGRFMVRFRNDADVILQETFSPTTTLTSAYQRLVYSVTAPPGATKATLHIGAITTATNQQVWNDDAMFYEGLEEIPFFDGSTPDDANYTYAWSGVAQQSTSTRTPIIERPLELFSWQPNTSAWNFLMVLCGAFGFRLFCDEARDWYLVDPNAYTVAGDVSVASSNATQADDTIDRDDDAWCTGVAIEWTWPDRWGIQQTRYETAGSAGRVRYLKVDQAFPGRGLAAAILARSSGRGRELSSTVAWDLTATPAMGMLVSLPGTKPQRSQIASVEWDISTGLMSVIGRSGRTVPDAPDAPTVTGSSTITISWTAPDDGGSPITGYTVRIADVGSSSGDSIPVTSSPLVVSGIAPGDKLVSVAAKNAIGQGPFSEATAVTIT